MNKQGRIRAASFQRRKSSAFRRNADRTRALNRPVTSWLSSATDWQRFPALCTIVSAVLKAKKPAAEKPRTPKTEPEKEVRPVKKPDVETKAVAATMERQAEVIGLRGKLAEAEKRLAELEDENAALAALLVA